MDAVSENGQAKILVAINLCISINWPSLKMKFKASLDISFTL